MKWKVTCESNLPKATSTNALMAWYCDDCNVKSVEMARLVFNMQERMLKSEKETENLRNDTKAKFEKN